MSRVTDRVVDLLDNLVFIVQRQIEKTADEVIGQESDSFGDLRPVLGAVSFDPLVEVEGTRNVHVVGGDRQFVSEPVHHIADAVEELVGEEPSGGFVRDYKVSFSRNDVKLIGNELRAALHRPALGPEVLNGGKHRR